MKHVCGGVIGYPITPSTEISETFEVARAEGQLNVWGKHPFFVETEGEHSAQSGALGAALVGGNYISNASSSQGILYALESHYVTVGKKIGGFVLQVAARVVSKHSLNVMAGHDDVYSLLPTGYTILFGSNQQEAADLAAISYRVSALSLVPVANAMDGFATSHVMSEVLLPEAELLSRYLGDPAGRIPCPTVAQEILFGAKGRLWQLNHYLDRHAGDFDPGDLAALRAHLGSLTDQLEDDDQGRLVESTSAWVPPDLRGQWRRAWTNAWAKGTRQLVPSLVDPNNPGLTGPVQNQPDFQAGAVDHMTHFAAAVPALTRQAMADYSALTGRTYQPLHCYGVEDADYVMVGLGSITEDVRAVLPYLRAQGLKVGVVSVKLLQPFPEAELAEALGRAKAVTVLERSDNTALTQLVSNALFKARANGERPGTYAGLPAIDALPQLTTAVFGLGGHDVQPRHLVAAFQHMVSGDRAPLVFLGSQFFDPKATGALAELQDKLRQAYPETAAMALTTEDNPDLLPPEALRIRFHSVGGYGTVATGKLLTDILAGMLNLHSKSAPKYGSEKSGAPTNFYITLSPEPVLITNAELEDVDIVVAPDHQVFRHTNPLKGLAAGGVFILQSDRSPLDVWRDLPGYARQAIRQRAIKFMVVDAFSVARRHAPTPELETRMMGIAFIGAAIGNVERIAAGGSSDQVQAMVRAEIQKKFGRKGETVVESNMAVIRDGMSATVTVDYDAPEFVQVESGPRPARQRTAALSAVMCPAVTTARSAGLFDPGYFDQVMGRPFREGTIAEAPVLPGTGLFMPIGTGATKDKGLFRRTVPLLDPEACTGCMECAIACPDSAIPNTVHEIHDLLDRAIDQAGLPAGQKEIWHALSHTWSGVIRQLLRADPADRPLTEVARQAAAEAPALAEERVVSVTLEAVLAELGRFPVARTRPFFTSVEKESPGLGGLLSVVIDPWKCTGCLQCVDVCGPHALTPVEQDEAVVAGLQERFETLTELPNTPKRFSAEALQPGGDTKRVLLDHANYYSITGGHGACRGCGEVTATHLFTALSRAIGQDKRRAHLRSLEALVADLAAKRESLGPDQAERIGRLSDLIDRLEARLYLYEGGPTGQGPAPTIVANSTGCSSVYSSTMPATPFIDPWVNSLFQDAQALAVGLFEGVVSQYVDEVKALRQARAELADAFDPKEDLSPLSWRDFSPQEKALLPTVMTISGDGAAYDIGFGALSRVLASGSPIKAVVLDTGGYSNTGGQASTASYTGQDADLARHGWAHNGKVETRKELGLLAVFHPNVFSCATATAWHGHYLSTVLRLLDYNEGAALMVTYTPCGTENGTPEDQSAARSRLAVESRMSPLFVHDPRAGVSLQERFSLEGNPDLGQLWTNRTIEHRGPDGKIGLLSGPLTPADFAYGEGRFAKHFHRIAADSTEAATALPIAEFIDLAPAQREGRTPFIWATDAEHKLIKVACTAPIVALVEDRRRNWQSLQYLAGQGVDRMAAAHRGQLDQLKADYADAVAARESSLDAIAEAMVSLVMSRDEAPALPGGLIASLSSGGAAPAAAAGSAPAATALADRPIWLDPADEPRCNDCGTCYQELPQLFEKATIVVDGATQVVGRLRPGTLDTVEVTPDLLQRCARVKATCDAEIIK
jgi:pyruvate-ferredoxin/flavodoxin oxidoreductase